MDKHGSPTKPSSPIPDESEGGGGLDDFVDVDRKQVLEDIGREESKGTGCIQVEASHDDDGSNTKQIPHTDSVADIALPSDDNLAALIETDSTLNIIDSSGIVENLVTPAGNGRSWDGSGGIDETKGSFDQTRKQLPQELAKGVVVLQCDSSAPGGICDVYLVGTAHVSRESCRVVQAVIRFLKPQVVFLELCSSRMPMLVPHNLQVPSMSEMVDMWKSKRMNTFGILYSWFLAKVAEKLEVFPGSEFRIAYEEAISYGAKVTLGDRPVEATLRRTWAKMSFWHKTKFLFCTVFQVIFLPSPEELNKMMQEIDDVDMITLLIQEMGKTFPSLMETLLHERDVYMSRTLLNVASQHNSVVAVVGKGHLSGITKNWKQPLEVDSLLELPVANSSWSSVKLWSAVAFAVGGIAIVSGLYLTNRR